MALYWQDLIVLLAIVTAGGYLARLAWRTLARRKTASCGACGTCGQGAGPTDLVALDELSRSAKTIAQLAPPASQHGR